MGSRRRPVHGQLVIEILVLGSQGKKFSNVVFGQHSFLALPVGTTHRLTCRSRASRIPAILDASNTPFGFYRYSVFRSTVFATSRQKYFSVAGGKPSSRQRGATGFRPAADERQAGQADRGRILMTVLPEFTTERTRDGDRLERELLAVRGHVAAASLAGQHSEVSRSWTQLGHKTCVVGAEFAGTARMKSNRISGLMVGERGFEPPTPWSRTRCSTRLSHSPILLLRWLAASG